MANNIRFLVALLTCTAYLEAVTVNPSLCPTNKIAPHKRIASYGSARTIGAFIDLLTPGDFPYNGPPNLNDLQESPQEADPGDCGEIEDYDENDLSSITPQGNRRQDRQNSKPASNSRWFNGLWSSNYPERPPYPQRPPNNPERPPNYPDRPPNYPERPPNYPERPPYYPQKPQYYPPRPPTTDRPQRPPYFGTRPPYWSGGLFGSNGYRPPLQQNPSDYIKPIHEYSEDNQVTYRPDIVGGSLGHVVGVSPVRPTVSDETTTARTSYDRYRTSTQRYTPTAVNPTRRLRARNMSSASILGSFVDLLFK